jgi:hypothetical protein
VHPQATLLVKGITNTAALLNAQGTVCITKVRFFADIELNAHHLKLCVNGTLQQLPKHRSTSDYILLGFFVFVVDGSVHETMPSRSKDAAFRAGTM